MEEHFLPPGFRFYPTEEEIISFYLNRILQGTGLDKLHRVIPSLDVYDYNPWDLPQYAGEYCRGDREQWFFFIPMKEKVAGGGRQSRLTDIGYWKATGSPGYVYSSGDNNNYKVIGVKKTMVFYQGRAPNGKKTEWKMNEYKAIQGQVTSSTTTITPPMLRHEWSLCRVYTQSKCVRAFDRRPYGVETSEPTSRVRGLHREDHNTKAKNKQTINSPENSSFEDPAATSNPSQDMDIDDKFITGDFGNDQSNLWDWEQLNWIP